VPPGGSRL